MEDFCISIFLIFDLLIAPEQQAKMGLNLYKAYSDYSDQVLLSYSSIKPPLKVKKIDKIIYNNY